MNRQWLKPQTRCVCVLVCVCEVFFTVSNTHRKSNIPIKPTEHVTCIQYCSHIKWVGRPLVVFLQQLQNGGKHQLRSVQTPNKIQMFPVFNALMVDQVRHLQTDRRMSLIYKQPFTKDMTSPWLGVRICPNCTLHYGTFCDFSRRYFWLFRFCCTLRFEQISTFRWLVFWIGCLDSLPSPVKSLDQKTHLCEQDCYVFGVCQCIMSSWEESGGNLHVLDTVLRGGGLRTTQMEVKQTGSKQQWEDWICFCSPLMN